MIERSPVTQLRYCSFVQDSIMSRSLSLECPWGGLVAAMLFYEPFGIRNQLWWWCWVRAQLQWLNLQPMCTCKSQNPFCLPNFTVQRWCTSPSQPYSRGLLCGSFPFRSYPPARSSSTQWEEMGLLGGVRVFCKLQAVHVFLLIALPSWPPW